MKIKNWVDGKRFVKKLFQQSGYFTADSSGVEGKPHWVLRIRKKMFEKKYYCLFKHSGKLFGTFAKQFDGASGQGESVNQEVLTYMENKGIDLLIIYDDCKVYLVKTAEIRAFAEKHGSIREQYGGETTVSFPMNLLQRLNKSDSSFP